MHDLAVTSKAKNIFLMRKLNNSVIFNLKTIPLVRKNKENVCIVSFFSQYIS